MPRGVRSATSIVAESGGSAGWLAAGHAAHRRSAAGKPLRAVVGDRGAAGGDSLSARPGARRGGAAGARSTGNDPRHERPVDAARRAVALVTTRGFGDVLTIGYQNRPRLFELAIHKPPPLAAASIEIDERLAADGTVLRVPDRAEIRRQLAELRTAGHRVAGDCLVACGGPSGSRATRGRDRPRGWVRRDQPVERGGSAGQVGPSRRYHHGRCLSQSGAAATTWQPCGNRCRGANCRF